MQLLVAAGILPISILWGGRQTELTLSLRLTSVAAALILGVFIYIIRYRAGLVGRAESSAAGAASGGVRSRKIMENPNKRRAVRVLRKEKQMDKHSANAITEFLNPTPIPVNGVELEVFEAGRQNKGNPIILCHGWPEHAYSACV